MSIVGLGLDVVNIPSFWELLNRQGTTFLGNFHPSELQPSAGESHTATRSEAEHLASRWAVKEAFIKAWSMSRFSEPPMLSDVSFDEIEVVHDAWDRPFIRLHGVVQHAVHESLPNATFHVSISHDVDTAAAVVIVETNNINNDNAPTEAQVTS